MNKLLTVSHLDSYYGHAQVLRDVTLSIEEGRVAALLGPNGAGKSTAMMSISGMVRLSDSSRITFQGEEIQKQSSDRIVSKGIVQVPQGRGVFPGLTVKENLLMGAYMRKDKKETEDEIPAVLDMFPKLKERLKQPAGTLSGGEQQMLAIMRGLMAHPKLLMLDEPSMGLAPVIVDQIYEQIAAINRTGMTIFLVEQNSSIALDVADYAYVLSSGKIVREGPSKVLAGENLLDAYFKA
ncbi:ABC transporter ATP-binding protein [Anaerolentibacter hominis]|uniref:ABC transporter ATP-binding protein n=1 Tax=Anaerolentibacter hominis TaxID=3079009 RepID=UPI0031B851AB